MSGQDDTSKRSLTRSGRARRSFLENGALTAAAATTVGLVPALRTPTASAKASTDSATCATVAAPMKDVEGKVAFITGGDSGIGLGIARACADAGMKVVITYRTKAHLDDAMKLLAGAGDRIHAINLDVT